MLTRRTPTIRRHDAAAFAAMRKAGRLTAEALDMLVPHVQPGVTDAVDRPHDLRLRDGSWRDFRRP